MEHYVFILLILLVNKTGTNNEHWIHTVFTSTKPAAFVVTAKQEYCGARKDHFQSKNSDFESGDLMFNPATWVCVGGRRMAIAVWKLSFSLLGKSMCVCLCGEVGED